LRVACCVSQLREADRKFLLYAGYLDAHNPGHNPAQRAQIEREYWKQSAIRLAVQERIAFKTKVHVSYSHSIAVNITAHGRTCNLIQMCGRAARNAQRVPCGIQHVTYMPTQAKWDARLKTLQNISNPKARAEIFRRLHDLADGDQANPNPIPNPNPTPDCYSAHLPASATAPPLPCTWLCVCCWSARGFCGKRHHCHRPPATGML
jgi:hypothetical protein